MGCNPVTEIGKHIVNAVKKSVSTEEDDGYATSLADIPEFSMLVKSQHKEAVYIKRAEIDLKNQHTGRIRRNCSSNIPVRPRQPDAIRTVRKEKEEKGNR